MDQKINSPGHRLARSVMLFQKTFAQFQRTELQQGLMGCKPGAMAVLMLLKNTAVGEPRELKVSEISKLMHITSPAVTQFLKVLEADGLIERRIDQADRRSVGIVLTERGKSAAQRAESVFTSAFGGLTEFLGEAQSEQLADLLMKAFQYFNMRDGSLYQLQWNGDEEA